MSAGLVSQQARMQPFDNRLYAKPIYPQRAKLLGPEVYAYQAAGSVQDGTFSGKMIVVETLVDEAAYPWQADWYRKKVESVYGAKAADRFRVWYIDHAMHGGPVTRPGQTENPAATRIVSYTGVLHQALRDVSAWVEKGVAPPANTNYRVVDSQVIPAASAAERKGVQPVVSLTVNGGVRADVPVGQAVTFAGIVEVPPNTGRIVALEWDFEGRGDYPVKSEVSDASGTRAAVTTSYTFTKPGTYFPALRATSQREGDAATPYARIQNLGRVRVVVK